MGLIDFPTSSIFQDKAVTSSIPDYFQNSEPPMICYRYNKPIRNIIFNFDKLVSDLHIHSTCIIHLILESVKILNLFTRQPVMLSLEI